MMPNQPGRVPRAAGGSRRGAATVVGLTGEIGAGKSAVAALLKEHGAAVIDADKVGHEVLNNHEVRDRIIARFGQGVRKVDTIEPGSTAIDRRALGAIVFADPRARQDLESIVHPDMRARFIEAIERERRAERGPGRLVVLDAAILLETGWDDLCDLVVFVDAPREQRLARVGRERGWSAADLEAREQAQWPSARKRRHADLVITNDAGIDSLRGAVEDALSRLIEPATPTFEASN